MQSDPRLATILAEAVEIASPSERVAYLDRVCGGEPALRREAEALVADYFRAGSFLQSPAALVGTLDQPVTERPGTQIGPYKLLQQIGEGGMGTVYMAEQSHPVQRKVALKVIKAGMDTGPVIARFEAERQALALMDHPNIAKVLDAGTTVAGRPYFVMELVKGVPITQYCDENHFPPRARLELFTQVCQAVQHAHQKGVIHRDIKPTNVLVTLYDDKPVPKVIDFGVAKATGGRLTERTMFTTFGQIVGTLEYMSPEQARLNALDVDTRGDIYSLGVLLYELLTGTTPFDKKHLREVAFDEMLRMIREEEPPKPSTRLSTSEGRASIAANRSMEPNKLSGLVRGELDWIVMKALEKDRNRRYETANGVAADVQRYLNDEQVQACPPSAMYCLCKSARRNRVALSVAAVVAVSLLLGIVGTTWQAIHVSRQRDRAVAAESLAHTQRLRAEQKSDEAARNLREARKAVDDWFTKISQTSLLDAPGLQPLRRGLLEAAAGYYRGLLEQSREDPDLRADLAAAHMRLSVIHITFDRNEDSMAEMLQGLKLVEQLIQERPRDTAFARRLAGYFRTSRDLYQGSQPPKDPVKAIAILTRSAEIWEKFASDNPDTPEFRGDLAGMYLLLSAIVQNNDIGLSLDYCLRSRAILDNLVPNAPGVDSYQDLLLLAINNQTYLIGKQQEPKDGDQVVRQAIVFLEDLSRRHSSELTLRLNVARLHHQLALRLSKSDPLEAEKVFRQALELLEALVVASPASAPFRRQLNATLQSMAIHLKGAGRVEEAEQFFRKSVEINEKLVLDFPDASDFRLDLAKRYRAQGEQKKATDPIASEQAFGRALAIHEKLTADFPGNKRLLDELKLCQDQLISLLKKPEKSAEMAVVVRRFLDHQAALAKKSPASPETRLAFANRCNDLGYALRGVGLRPEAEKLVRQGLQLKLELVAEFPEKPIYRWHLAHSYLGLAIIAGELELTSDAINANAEAGKIFSELVADQSAVADFRDGNAHALWRVGEGWEKLNREQEAKQAYEQALVAFQQLEKDHPTNRFYRQEQAFSYRLLSRLCERAGRNVEALRYQREAVAISQKLSDEAPDSTGYRDALAYVQMRLAEFLIRDGQIGAAEPHVAAAIANYGKLYAIAPADAAKQRGFAEWLNNLTWPLAMKLNPSEEAVRLSGAMSKRALELTPAAGHIWNTAAMVRFRSGDFEEALAAHDKASELGFRNESSQLFAAMIHWQLGKYDQARKQYEMACQSIDKHQPGNEGLRLLRMEAEELMKKEPGARDRK